MKNILVFFVILFFGQQVVGSQSQDLLSQMLPYVEDGDLEYVAHLNTSAHVRALEIAAEGQNEERFKFLLMNQNDQQKEESIEFFRKMSGLQESLGLENKDTEDINSK